MFALFFGVELGQVFSAERLVVQVPVGVIGWEVAGNLVLHEQGKEGLQVETGSFQGLQQL